MPILRDRIEYYKYDNTVPQEIISSISQLKAMLDCKIASRRDLEKLSGLLYHFSKVVRGRRSFTRRIFELISVLRISSTKLYKGGLIVLV